MFWVTMTDMLLLTKFVCFHYKKTNKKNRMDLTGITVRDTYR